MIAAAKKMLAELFIITYKDKTQKELYKVLANPNHITELDVVGLIGEIHEFQRDFHSMEVQLDLANMAVALGDLYDSLVRNNAHKR